jgi:hypothetical protein
MESRRRILRKIKAAASIPLVSVADKSVSFHTRRAQFAALESAKISSEIVFSSSASLSLHSVMPKLYIRSRQKAKIVVALPVALPH